MARKKSATDAGLAQLRAFGLGYPGAHLKSPWPGHKDLAVNDKTFCYLSVDGEPFSISCKLPDSCHAALALPGTKPTAYGLGRSGWVSAAFPGPKLPLDMLKEWIDESYRAQAPKRLIKELDGGAPPKKKSAKKKSTKKKSAKKKTAKKKAAKKKTAKKKSAKKKTAKKKAAKKKARRRDR